MFNQFIIMYLFLGGCGSGILLIASLRSLMFHACPDRSKRETEVFRRWRNQCYVVGLIVTAVGAVCLLADLGRPERFLLLFFRPNSTYLTFGTFVLSALVATGLFLCASNILFVSWVKLWMRKVAEALCAVFSVAVMTYTGLFLQGLYAVAFWDTWFTPCLFVCSALSMGLSACFIIGALLRDSWLLQTDARGMRVAHIVIVACEAASLAGFLFAAGTGRVAAQESLGLLLSDPLLAWFAFGVLGCGLVLPIAVEGVLLGRRLERPLPLADALCIFGGFALRFCIVSAGLH